MILFCIMELHPSGSVSVLWPVVLDSVCLVYFICILFILFIFILSFSYPAPSMSMTWPMGMAWA